MVVFEEINIPRGVESVGSFEKLGLASTNYPGPYHDGDGELFFFRGNFIPFDTPHDWAVGR